MSKDEEFTAAAAESNTLLCNRELQIIVLRPPPFSLTLASFSNCRTWVGYWSVTNTQLLMT